MSNKNFKYIFVVLTIFFSFFIGGKEVKAECKWISPFTYINEFGLPSGIKSKISYDSDDDAVSGLRGADFSEYSSLTSYKLKYNNSRFYIGYAVESLTYHPKSAQINGQGGYNIYLGNSYENITYNGSNTNWSSNGCPTYIKVSFDNSGSSDEMIVEEATESQYISYLRSGGQYKNLFSSSNLYGYYINLYAKNTHDNNFLKFTDTDGSFYDMITETGSEIYFVNISVSETYPSTNWNKFKSLLSRSTRDVSDDEIKTGLGNLIDTGTSDNITYTKAYYDATKTLWSNFMGENVTGSSGDSQRREWFKKWFTKSVARYMFEDDYNRFLRYWEYMYYDECSSNDCDLDGDSDGGTDKDKEIYYAVVEILELMDDADDVDDCHSTNSNDPCISICATTCEAMQNSSLISACSQSSTYTTCSECTSECSSRCQNIGLASSQETCKTTCYDECTNGAYSALMQELDDEEQAIADAIADAVMTLYNLTIASAPTLSGVTFDNYKVDCDDVSFLHTFYNIIRILAPILVILFGTLDYTKSVMGADEQKILEARKKLPKRILLLVLLILIPFLINAILSLADIDTSLITCILNGE